MWCVLRPGFFSQSLSQAVRKGGIIEPYYLICYSRVHLVCAADATVLLTFEVKLNPKADTLLGSI